MAINDDLLTQYQGHVVPQRYNVGFVILSYIVSLVGAGSTLELIYRRTGSRGLFNHLLLGGAAVAMGGVAIWSMHFVGNRAIELGNGEPELQAAYASGSTAVSFFVPIAVLLAAFLALGTNERVSWIRISAGGLLCGVAVCGMHYLGNASIANYRCIYHIPNIIGAAITAVAANFAALSMFFVFRSTWTSSWWKRWLSAVIMAGAVSGMHWCAAVGTEYKLLTLKPVDNGLSRNSTVIIVICLAVASAATIVVTAIVNANKRSRASRRAQQITLGAAVFDKDNRILVDSYGRIPSVLVTDSFPQSDKPVEFDTNHPLFHWMFQASRSWRELTDVLEGIKRHFMTLPSRIELVDPQGELVEGSDTICREMFCAAAMNLSEQLKEDVTSAGVLWDEILKTGISGKEGGRMQTAQDKLSRMLGRKPSTASDEEGIVEKLNMASRRSTRGRGAVLFLVERVQTEREAERLAWAGYRFAEVQQVSNIIESSMQIQTHGLEQKLRQMAQYSGEGSKMAKGLHLGLFAVRARVGSPGFDVLVRKGAKDALLSELVQKGSLDASQRRFLAQFQGMTAAGILQRLNSLASSSTNASERELAANLTQAILALKADAQDNILDSAVLGPNIVEMDDDGGAGVTMLSFQALVPIHVAVTQPDLELVPLSLFKAHQLARRDRQAFVEAAQHEFAPIMWGSMGHGVDEFELKATKGGGSEADGDDDRSMTTRIGVRPASFLSTSSSSKAELWSGAGNSRSKFASSDKARNKPQSVSFPSRTQIGGGQQGGIMITQVVSISTETPSSGGGGGASGTVVSSEGWTNSTMETDATAAKKTDSMSRVVRSGDLEGPQGLSFVDALFTSSLGGRVP